MVLNCMIEMVMLKAFAIISSFINKLNSPVSLLTDSIDTRDQQSTIKSQLLVTSSGYNFEVLQLREKYFAIVIARIYILI